MKRFVPKYLDHARRLGQIQFGLIMMLTVTLAVELAVDEVIAGIRALLQAAPGSNMACGVIHAAIYVMNAVTAVS